MNGTLVLGSLREASRNGLGAAVLMLLMLAMVVVPLPPLLLDVLFTFNIALGLVVLLGTVYVRSPLELAAFPTVLLLATLLRLSLNIASTRVVLLNGHQGPAAAGHVIESFGNFVIGGDYAVGLVVFVILIIINFVVVTKGASRISEVSARFTLDAMPGKQMAIDADLNAGLITQDEARQRRAEVSQEADFYGAMDGAGKFVRGDAVAGILVLLINLIGGIAVGTLQHGMAFTAVVAQNAHDRDRNGEEAGGVKAAQRCGFRADFRKDRLGFDDLVEPERDEQRIEIRQRITEALRGDDDGSSKHDCTVGSGCCKASLQGPLAAVARCQRHAETTERGQSVEAERQAIAGHSRIARGRNGREKQNGDGNGERKAIGHGRRTERAAVIDPQGGDAEAGRRDQRRGFGPDGNGNGRQDAPDGVVRRSITAVEQHGGKTGHQHKLGIVVVNGTRQKLVGGDDQKARQGHGNVHGGITAEAARAKAHGDDEQRHEKERPDGDGQHLSAMCIGEQTKQQDQPGNRRIDDARPVHERTAIQTKAILHHIEPALPGQKIAHFDQTHAVVIVGTDIIPGIGNVQRENDGHSQNAENNRHQRQTLPPDKRFHLILPRFHIASACWPMKCVRHAASPRNSDRAAT